MINIFIPRLAIISLFLAIGSASATAGLRRTLPLVAKISGAVLSTRFLITHRTAEPSEEERPFYKARWHPLTGHQSHKVTPSLPVPAVNLATITLTAEAVKNIIPDRYKDFVDKSNLATLLVNRELTPTDLIRIFDTELNHYLVIMGQLYPYVASDIHRMYSTRNRILIIKRLAADGDKHFITQLDGAIKNYYGLEIEDCNYPSSK